jgi:hypothetical protein
MQTMFNTVEDARSAGYIHWSEAAQIAREKNYVFLDESGGMSYGYRYGIHRLVSASNDHPEHGQVPFKRAEVRSVALYILEQETILGKKGAVSQWFVKSEVEALPPQPPTDRKFEEMESKISGLQQLCRTYEKKLRKRERGKPPLSDTEETVIARVPMPSSLHQHCMSKPGGLAAYIRRLVEADRGAKTE